MLICFGFPILTLLFLNFSSMDEISVCLKAITSSLSSSFSFGGSKLSKKLSTLETLLSKTPSLTQDDFEKVFVGDESSKLKGLLHVCGSQSTISGSLRKSARKAMEIVFGLVNERKEALTALNLLESDELALMKLHLHLAREDSIPFQVARIIQESRPFLPIESYVTNRYAQNKFKAFLEAEQKKGTKAVKTGSAKEAKPKVWKDEENEEEIKQLMVQGQIVAQIQRKEVVQMSKINDLKRDRTLEYFRQHFFDPLATDLGEAFSVRRVTERVRKLGRSSLAQSGYRPCPQELMDTVQFLHIESPDFNPFYLVETLHANDSLEQFQAGYERLKAQSPEEDRPEKGILVDLYFVYVDEMFQAERFATAFVQDCVIKKDKISADVEVTRLLSELKMDFLNCSESQILEKKLVVSYKMLARFLSSYERLLRFPEVLSLHLLRGELKQFHAEWQRTYPQLKTLSKYTSPTFKELNNVALGLFFRWKASLIDQIQNTLLFQKNRSTSNEAIQPTSESFDDSGIFGLFVEVCEPEDVQALLNGAKIALKSIMSEATADFAKTVKMSTKSVKLRFKDSLIGEMNKVKEKKNRLDLLSNDCDNLRAFIIGRHLPGSKMTQTRSLLEQIKHAERLMVQQFLPSFLQTLRLLDNLRSKHSSSVESEVFPSAELFYSDGLQSIADAVKSLCDLAFGEIGESALTGKNSKGKDALKSLSRIFERIVASLSDCARFTAVFNPEILEIALKSILSEVSQIEHHLFYRNELPEALSAHDSRRRRAGSKQEEICVDFMGRNYTQKSFVVASCLFGMFQKFSEKEVQKIIDFSFFSKLSNEYFGSCLTKACEVLSEPTLKDDPTIWDLVCSYIGLDFLLKSVQLRGPSGFELDQDYGLADLEIKIKKKIQKQIKEALNLPYNGKIEDPAPAFEGTLLDPNDIRVLRGHIIKVIDLFQEAKSNVVLMKNDTNETIWLPILRKTAGYIAKIIEEREGDAILQHESGFLINIIGAFGLNEEISENLRELGTTEQAKKLSRVWKYKLASTHSILFGK